MNNNNKRKRVCRTYTKEEDALLLHLIMNNEKKSDFQLVSDQFFEITNIRLTSGQISGRYYKVLQHKKKLRCKEKVTEFESEYVEEEFKTLIMRLKQATSTAIKLKILVNQLVDENKILKQTMGLQVPLQQTTNINILLNNL